MVIMTGGDYDFRLSYGREHLLKVFGKGRQLVCSGTQKQILQLKHLAAFPAVWRINSFVTLLIFERRFIPIAVAFRIVHSFEEGTTEMLVAMKTMLYRWCRPAALDAVRKLLT
uniref:LSDAT_euk domain-containing protein n=1 Tax=Ascaris lumbricoides TaxID=6252 RepID=A0A0M3HSF8_ASCLU